MTRRRAAGPSAARTRARWALWTLIGVNAVMLWFFVGMAASLDVHAKVLDRSTLQACAGRALADQGAYAYAATFDDVRFVGDATIRFDSEFEEDSDDGGRGIVEVVGIECTVRAAPDDNERILVVRAETVDR